MIGDDLDGMNRDQLAAEVQKLREGIRKHRDSSGQELCWHHPELWSLLPERTDPVPVVPEWPEFLRGCVHYRQSLDKQLPDAPRAPMNYEPQSASHDRSILWRRVDVPGHEFVRLHQGAASGFLSGSAVFLHEGLPCNLTYVVRFDGAWLTTGAEVSGWVGDRVIAAVVAVDANREWTLNGERRPAVRGSLDVDLNFSPATNLLPIRRLKLAVGESAEVRAAWLRFPSFQLEPLTQTYTRSSVSAYRYESAGGRFSAPLQVDDEGLPTSYGDIWLAETG